MNVPTSKLTYNQLLTVILDELHARCHVHGLVADTRETTLISPGVHRGSFSGHSNSSAADAASYNGRASEPTSRAYDLRRTPSWKSEAAYFVPHGKKDLEFKGSDTETTLGKYRAFDLYLEGPFN